MIRKKKLKPNPKRNTTTISDKRISSTSTTSYQKKKVKNKTRIGRRVLLAFIFLLLVELIWFAVTKLFDKSHKDLDVQINEMPVSQITETSMEEETLIEDSDIYYYYSSLPTDKKELYDAILNGINKCKKSIVLRANIEKELSEITSMIMYDHPELFWIDGSYRYTSDLDKTELEMTYLYDKGEIEKRQKEIDAAADLFLFEINDSDSQYETAKKAFCYIIDTVTYVAGCSDNQNIYSSLVNHESVCSGYTRAFQYLLQKCGIQVLYVSGTANGSHGWDNHAWNIIRCDGEYYHVDVTFGDGYTNIEDDRISYQYEYLCTDDRTIFRNHKITSELPVPSCTSMKNNYYVLNGAYSEKYDEQVKVHMRNEIESGSRVWVYQFSNHEAYKECLNDVKKSVYSMAVCEYLNESCITTYSYNDAMYCVSCWY